MNTLEIPEIHPILAAKFAELDAHFEAWEAKREAWKAEQEELEAQFAENFGHPVPYLVPVAEIPEAELVEFTEPVDEILEVPAPAPKAKAKKKTASKKKNS